MVMDFNTRWLCIGAALYGCVIVFVAVQASSADPNGPLSLESQIGALQERVTRLEQGQPPCP